MSDTDDKVVYQMGEYELRAAVRGLRLRISDMTQERDALRRALEASCIDARNEHPEAGMGACPQWDAIIHERDALRREVDELVGRLAVKVDCENCPVDAHKCHLDRHSCVREIGEWSKKAAQAGKAVENEAQ